MTTHDALLAAVLAEPGDDAPRLILADWLEEQGDDACERLRQPGYLVLEPGTWVSDPVRVYWVTEPQHHAPVGCIAWLEYATRFRCACGGGKAYCAVFGGWKCLQCCAREATRTGRGVWQMAGVKP
jgi:uncharacterized protein (TIGR02996 family)